MKSNNYLDCTYAVTKDCEVVHKGNYNSCCTYLLDAQPFSISFAKNEGWDIIKI